MAYQTSLGSTTLFLEQQAEQTVLRLHADGQDQSAAFTTGAWTQTPRLYHVSGGAAVLELHGSGVFYYAVHDGQLRALDEAPALDGAAPVDWQQRPDGSDPSGPEPMKPMAPMKPMKPM